jgi:hypothetical protein
MRESSRFQLAKLPAEAHQAPDSVSVTALPTPRACFRSGIVPANVHAPRTLRDERARSGSGALTVTALPTPRACFRSGIAAANVHAPRTLRDERRCAARGACRLPRKRRGTPFDKLSKNILQLLRTGCELHLDNFLRLSAANVDIVGEIHGRDRRSRNVERCVTETAVPRLPGRDRHLVGGGHGLDRCQKSRGCMCFQELRQGQLCGCHGGEPTHRKMQRPWSFLHFGTKVYGSRCRFERPSVGVGARPRVLYRCRGGARRCWRRWREAREDREEPEEFLVSAGRHLPNIWRMF